MARVRPLCFVAAATGALSATAPPAVDTGVMTIHPNGTAAQVVIHDGLPPDRQPVTG